MDFKERRMGVACSGIAILIIGIIVTLSAMHTSALAASGGIGSWMLTNAATASYLFGVPTLLFGILWTLKAFLMIDPTPQQVYQIPPKVSQVAPDSREVVCPDCGNVLGRELGMMKPDGTVVCSKCYKRFIPPP